MPYSSQELSRLKCTVYIEANKFFFKIKEEVDTELKE